MNAWLKKQSLRMRLTLWYSCVASVIFLLFGILLLIFIQQRLGAELDRQLRIDFDFIAFRLDRTPTGEVRWTPAGLHADDGLGRTSAWFEVWSPDGKLLLRHWPVDESRIGNGLPAPRETELKFHSTELEEDLH